jgi:metal-sulfur cluster biosynthetic enzyme
MKDNANPIVKQSSSTHLNEYNEYPSWYKDILRHKALNADNLDKQATPVEDKDHQFNTQFRDSLGINTTQHIHTHTFCNYIINNNTKQQQTTYNHIPPPTQHCIPPTITFPPPSNTPPTPSHDPYTPSEIFNYISTITDPEHPLTLSSLSVVSPTLITISPQSRIHVTFTPTVPHCSMATLIGLCVSTKLSRSLPLSCPFHVSVTPGTHANDKQVSKQLGDKDRVKAALENGHLRKVVEECIKGDLIV